VKEPFEFFHKIPTNFIKMYPVGSLQSTHWVLCWVLFESAHHLPAGYEPGELMGTFENNQYLPAGYFAGQIDGYF